MTYKLKELEAGNNSSNMKFFLVEMALIRKESVSEEEYEQLSDSSKSLLEEVAE